MRVLGIDTGFAIAGWSIVDKNKDKLNGLELVDYGAVITDAGVPIEQRLATLYTSLDKIIKDYKPDCVAIESLFFFKNQKTVMNVSQARGVIILVCHLNGLEINDYTPLQVKTTVTGYGRAEKKQIQKMVKLILGLKEIPKPDDAADAIAIAICHINNSKLLKLTKR